MPKPLQVYIVEDSPAMQQLLASAILAAEAELSGCGADSQTAVGDVFALEPDLILIDIGLASGTGFDVLKALQDHSLAPGATKVVLTNYTSAEYKNLSARLGADRFFDKSAETAQALALIGALAAEKRTRDASLQSSSAVSSPSQPSRSPSSPAFLRRPLAASAEAVVASVLP